MSQHPHQTPAHRLESESRISLASVSVTSQNTKPDSEHYDDSPETSRMAICYLRMGVLTVTVIAAIIVASIIFVVIRNQEDLDFEDRFNLVALAFFDEVNDNIGLTLSALEMMTISFTSHADEYNQTWPFVTLPDFEAKADSARAFANSFAMGLVPIVSLEDRTAWEDYSVFNAEWIEDGFQYDEDVLGLPHLRRLEEDTEHRDTSNLAGSFSDSIFRLQMGSANPGLEADNSEGPYMPAWQNAPVFPGIVNYNMLSWPGYQDSITACLESKRAVLSRTMDLRSGLLSQVDPVAWANNPVYVDDPVSMIHFPIFEDLKPNQGSVVGIVYAFTSWSAYLRNVLPDDIEGVRVVLENECGQVHTFEINGPYVEYVGAGDHHYKTYVSAAVQVPVAVSRSGTELFKEYCPYKMTAYPSNVTRETFLTNRPTVFTFVAVLIFMFSFCLLSIYDSRVQKRHREVEQAAVENRRIVASLFPPAIRERMFSLNKRAQVRRRGSVAMGLQVIADELEGGKGSDKEQAPVLREKDGLIPSALLGKELEIEAPGADLDRRPIADLFPHATVLFADIAGFTAWSSQREPTQVFTLLQTLYGNFDRIAKKLGVFKIETIGDCYVAVTGLPEPQDDHAVRMARFARECLHRMQRLAQKLEVTLGPDTADLSLRVGLHSGPVTAGVLRGEKSRFQLFGDSVNTASRMESTGFRGKIQCSLATAKLLEEGGKGMWLTEREDMVVAKGKGEMKTYWIAGRSQDMQTTEQFQEEHRPMSENEDLDGESEHMARARMGSSSRRTSTTENSDSEHSQENHRPTNCSAHSDSSEYFSSEDERPRYTRRNLARGANAREKRLIEWHIDMLSRLLKAVVASRSPTGATMEIDEVSKGRSQTCNSLAAEVILFPKLDPSHRMVTTNLENKSLPAVVEYQLRDYVCTIAGMYGSNPFHCFEHASQVAMSANKLLNQIESPSLKSDTSDQDTKRRSTYCAKIKFNPLTHFAVVLAAVIHDVDHPGCSNADLVESGAEVAEAYNFRSVNEHKSFDVAWELLMDPAYAELLKCICLTRDDFEFFHQLLLNLVLATDLFDEEQKSFREKRWATAFGTEPPAGLSSDYIKNLQATVLLEQTMQVSDISHTMQHWHIFQKWNGKLFEERRNAFNTGLSAKDPSSVWYEEELSFFDNYAIPFAKKLQESGAFGVTSNLFLEYAVQNRSEWAMKGRDMVRKTSLAFADKEAPLALLNTPVKIDEEDGESHSEASGAIE